MQKLGDKHAFNATNRALRYVRLRLLRRPESQGLSAEAQGARAQLREKYEAWQEAREVRAALTAEVYYADSVVDKLAMDAGRRVLVETDNRRDAPLFKALFLEPPSDALKPVAGGNQNQFIENLIDGLNAQLGGSQLHGLAQPLATAHGELQGVLREREAAARAEAQAKVTYELSLDETRRFYNALYHRVSLLWPADNALIESCFAKLAKPSKRKVEADDDDDDGDDERDA